MKSSDSHLYHHMPEWLKAKNVDWSALETSQPGLQLARVRQALNVDIANIAAGTAIHTTKLQALERDDYDEIGAPTFVTGYIRQYAKQLGVSPEPFIAACRVQQNAGHITMGSLRVDSGEAPGTQKAKRVSRRLSSYVLALRHLPMWSIVSVGLLLWAMIVMLMPSQQAPPTDEIVAAPAPSPVAALKENAAEVQSNAAASLDATPADELQSDPVGIPSDRARVDALVPSSSASIEVAPEDDTPLEDVPVAQDDVLVMSFDDECWTEVTDVTGKLLLARLQRGGDNLQLTGQGPFSVKLGNAHVVTMAVNGRSVLIEPRPGRNTIKLLVNP